MKRAHRRSLARRVRNDAREQIDHLGGVGVIGRPVAVAHLVPQRHLALQEEGVVRVGSRGAVLRIQPLDRPVLQVVGSAVGIRVVPEQLDLRS